MTVEELRRKYSSAYQLFYHERFQHHRMRGLLGHKMGSKINDEWTQLSERKRMEYEERF